MLADASIGEKVNSDDQFAPLKVVLPDELQKFYSGRGYLPTMQHEDRGHARLNVRALGNIRFFHSPLLLQFDLIAKDHRQGTVLIKDLSKTGIAILYHRQIFPGECFEILLHGRTIEAKAVRCHRIGPKCYETGGIIHHIYSEAADELTEADSWTAPQV